MDEQKLKELALGHGADGAEMIAVADIPFFPEFRAACAENTCGHYGRNWMCPPDVGDIHQLIDKAKTYDRALIYQTISPLEDSYDFEGMEEGARLFSLLSQALDDDTKPVMGDILHIGAGCCMVCEQCSKLTDEPCRHPDKAQSSLESYGMAVSQLAKLCGLNYINGTNTVTYFGALLFHS